MSATEHARMVSAGELPESVHGADVHMQIPGADAQRVSSTLKYPNLLPYLIFVSNYFSTFYIYYNDNENEQQGYKPADFPCFEPLETCSN